MALERHVAPEGEVRVRGDVWLGKFGGFGGTPGLALRMHVRRVVDELVACAASGGTADAPEASITIPRSDRERQRES